MVGVENNFGPINNRFIKKKKMCKFFTILKLITFYFEINDLLTRRGTSIRQKNSHIPVTKKKKKRDVINVINYSYIYIIIKFSSILKLLKYIYKETRIGWFEEYFKLLFLKICP